MEDNKLTPFADVPDTEVITCCHVMTMAHLATLCIT